MFDAFMLMHYIFEVLDSSLFEFKIWLMFEVWNKTKVLF